MEVRIDPGAGFCFGVKRAIGIAEQELEDGPLFSLGEIVHNQGEVERLQQKGLVTSERLHFPDLSGKRVLLRAHGEPPETYQLARQSEVELIDATCPIVAHVQKKVQEAYRNMQTVKGQVVLFGKKHHPETIGLLGHTDNTGIVIREPEDLDNLDYSRPIALFAQTTMSPVAYGAMAKEIRKRYIARGMDPDQMLNIHNTICRYVSSREEQVREFARLSDVIIFVSGRNSSNGNLLFTYCREENPRAYIVTSAEEVKHEWLHDASSVGISGATSTPFWLMEQVKEKLLQEK